VDLFVEERLDFVDNLMLFFYLVVDSVLNDFEPVLDELSAKF
jgi:hypothetical protein